MQERMRRRTGRKQDKMEFSEIEGKRKEEHCTQTNLSPYSNAIPPITNIESTNKPLQSHYIRVPVIKVPMPS